MHELFVFDFCHCSSFPVTELSFTADLFYLDCMHISSSQKNCPFCQVEFFAIYCRGSLFGFFSINSGIHRFRAIYKVVYFTLYVWYGDHRVRGCLLVLVIIERTQALFYFTQCWVNFDTGYLLLTSRNEGGGGGSESGDSLGGQ